MIFAGWKSVGCPVPRYASLLKCSSCVCYYPVRLPFQVCWANVGASRLSLHTMVCRVLSECCLWEKNAAMHVLSFVCRQQMSAPTAFPRFCSAYYFGLLGFILLVTVPDAKAWTRMESLHRKSPLKLYDDQVKREMKLLRNIEKGWKSQPWQTASS